MFDDIRCQYPLPVVGANDLSYQTKSLDSAMNQYEIREDGSLWMREYDIDADAGPQAWRPRQWTGEIRFYTTRDETLESWIEWSAYFVRGAMQSVTLIAAPQSIDAVDPPVSSTGTPTTRA